jgi:UDP-N-acetylmuramoyl-L-alanyl-D-glutamate--2,6-diaminopimelate ligase
VNAPGKSLNALLAGVAAPRARDVTVRALALDSRAVVPGALFLALPGGRHDGRSYIADAIARGATAVVYDAGGFDPGALPVPAVGVARLAQRASLIADRFYDGPSRRLAVIGVTGTNGKTTCTQLIAQALDRPPRRCAVIGTLGYGFPGALDAGAHTTPDAVHAQRLLAGFAERGADWVAMEVSSHALEQGRVQAVSFAAAVFTNLSRDHLDYHGDMERYAAAKARLFCVPGLRAAVLNAEDDWGRRVAGRIEAGVRVLTYGFERGDVHALRFERAREGLYLRAATPEGEVEITAPLFGRFNGANLLAVLATLIALGLEAGEAARRLCAVAPVPGRVERFAAGDDRPLVVVDYAHTPDALAQVLTELRAHTAGRLWCVFGCGGERDRGKRPQMGAIAERLADVVIVTDDNPRREPGDAIVRDILAGMRAPARVIRERRAALAAAIDEARADDVVLIAGKGHEDYQQIGEARLPYSDRDTVRALLGLAA